MKKYEKVLDALWRDYSALNPDVRKVHDLLTAKGETVVNDHIAFRTFDMGPANLAFIAQKFIDLGWRKGGDYDIREKKVTAIHLNPPFWHLPKVFVSELRTEEFSPDFRAIVTDLVRRIPYKKLGSDEFLWSGAPWGKIPTLRYQRLQLESEYAAWLSAFGFRANHFTVSVNALKFTQDLSVVNRLLLANGFRLNESGGLIKGSPGQYLEQSSTMAQPVEVQFIDGTYSVPGCYYEFAKRYPLPNGWLFQGFIESSATKIFDSTSSSAAQATHVVPPAASKAAGGSPVSAAAATPLMNGVSGSRH